VMGHKVSLTQEDTQCDLADAVPATQQLLSKGVSGVIGPETQEIAAVEPILKNTKIVDEFQGGGTSYDHQTDPFVFRDSPSDSQLGVAMALYAHQHGYRRAAMLFYTDIAAQTLIKPIITTFQKLGGTVSTTVNVAPGQTSYVPEIQKVLATKPDVIFTQTDAPTAAVLYRDLKQTNNLAIPLVGTDVTGASEYLKAVTFPVANAHLVSVYGTSVSGKASEEFTKQFNASFPGQQPLANANYAYDAVVSLALAQEAAKSSDGTKVAAAMKKVTNPPGTACFAFATCKKLLAAGTKINYEGASGSLDYNQYHNVFGPYGAWRVDLKGNEQQVHLLSAAALAKATP
jgi:ABC-type branched-subunit amino acid transport system substrate-binding protein